jgi:hypothetical protein
MLKAYRKDGSEVREGDELVDFRGELWIFIQVSRHKIYAKKKDKEWRQEFFSTVFDLEVLDDAVPNLPD